MAESSPVREMRIWVPSPDDSSKHVEKIIEVTDPKPRRSIVVFKALSDAMWDSPKVLEPGDYMRHLPVELSMEETRDLLNAAVGDIDERFIYAGAGKDLPLKGGDMEPEERTIPKEALEVPAWASLTAIKADDRYGFARDIKVEGRRQPATFVGDHKDWHRLLETTLTFVEDKYTRPQFRYSIWRDLSTQDKAGKLDLTVHYSPLAWGGYEGHQIYRKNMTVKQELRVLELFQALGGISLEKYETPESPAEDKSNRFTRDEVSSHLGGFEEDYPGITDAFLLGQPLVDKGDESLSASDLYNQGAFRELCEELGIEHTPEAIDAALRPYRDFLNDHPSQ